MLSPDSSQSEGGSIFSAKLESLGTIATLLKAVVFSEKVNLFISENGLKFTVEEGKYVQAYVLIQKELFQEYILTEEEAYFKIPLKELLECLKVFCSDGKGIDATMDNLPNTSLKLLYKNVGSPFEILLEENGIKTEFKLKTEEVDNLMEYDIDPVECKISLRSESFFELLQAIDQNGPEIIAIEVKPDERMMVISGKTTAGWLAVMIPEISAVVEYFECGTTVRKSRYRFSILKYSFKAIQISDKLVLKMNSDGVLSLSFLLTTKADSFVEFFMSPLQMDDDDEEGDA